MFADAVQARARVTRALVNFIFAVDGQFVCKCYGGLWKRMGRVDFNEQLALIYSSLRLTVRIKHELQLSFILLSTVLYVACSFLTRQCTFAASYLAPFGTCIQTWLRDRTRYFLCGWVKRPEFQFRLTLQGKVNREFQLDIGITMQASRRSKDVF